MQPEPQPPQHGSFQPFRTIPADGKRPSDADVTFSEDIRAIQAALKEYVSGLLGWQDGVEDLVQETNLFLWERRIEFEPGTNFRAWAMRVAWFKVMAERRDRARSGRVVFSEEIISRLAARAEERMEETDGRLRALKRCLEFTRVQDRRLLEWKYGRRENLTDLAAGRGISPGSLHKTISRLRLVLRHCVEKQLKEESSI
ncbi:MAG: sigma-70 family RNA polymerase sigma factor [Luteolibacter sp.]|jgi:RNA polymerase sigma-70 factor (ECF subfamily)|nr:sigma-70 family RNA polymerase sigma factor [Luteolibacter sp.]